MIWGGGPIMEHRREVEEEDDLYAYTVRIRCLGAHPLYHMLSRRGLEPLKLANNPYQQDGQVKLTPLTDFSQYASSSGITAHCYGGQDSSFLL